MAAPPPMTTRRFIETVAASGLVDEATRQRFDRIIEPWAGLESPVDQRLLDELAAASIVTPWQASQLVKGRYKGFFLGKYRLLRLLGSGGMSSVYEAEHAELGHHVAIKVLPPRSAERSSFLQRFKREARASARLSHPNLARVSDIDSCGDVHFMVMEYVEGIDLHKRVKEQGALPVREAVDLARQAALGLEYAHQEGFIHRDVKPANMILDRRGTLKVLDLGLALPSADEDRMAALSHEHDEKVLGTADYLSPEQAQDSHTADKRSDIYSLGCTLFFLLAGKGPFSGGSITERIRRHIHDPPPSLLDLRPEVPPAIAEVVYRMMEKHPDARYQSAAEVAEVLGAWLATNLPSAAPSAPARPRTSRDALRRQPTGPGGTAATTAARRTPARPPAAWPESAASGSLSMPESLSPLLRPDRSGIGTDSASAPGRALGPADSLSAASPSSPTSDVHEVGGAVGDSFLEPSLSSVLAVTPSPHVPERSTIIAPIAPVSRPGHARGGRRSRQRSDLLGFPIEAWVMLGLGILAASVLALMLALR